MAQIEVKAKVVCWGRTSTLENGVVIASGSFGPKRSDMTADQWADFEAMRDGDNQEAEAPR